MMQKRCLYSISGLGFPPFHQRHTPVKRRVSASLEGDQTSCLSERDSAEFPVGGAPGRQETKHPASK
ncbi:hypothetical protein J6590_011602 [Homalodisca vitripennis]|nr:hypothetical protein J6590_011602 [Homalodisca vitripennis]